MTGIGPFAIELAPEMALHRNNRSRSFRRKRKNFVRTSVNKFSSQLHWERRSRVRVNTATKAIPRFQERNAQPGLSKMAGGCESGDSTADNQCVHNFAAVTSSFDAPETGIGYTPSALAAPISTMRTSFGGVFLSQA